GGIILLGIVRPACCQCPDDTAPRPQNKDSIIIYIRIFLGTCFNKCSYILKLNIKYIAHQIGLMYTEVTHCTNKGTLFIKEPTIFSVCTPTFRTTMTKRRAKTVNPANLTSRNQRTRLPM